MAGPGNGVEGRMRFRKLRIAFSATCLIACVLLIVLWVRSYWCVDVVSGYHSKLLVFGLGSERGNVGCEWMSNPTSIFQVTEWRARSYPPGNEHITQFV